MDIIVISELRVEILVGVYQWETQVPQKIQLDLEIALPGRKAGASDQLADTIDYAAVVTRIEDALQKTRFALLEKLAEHVADLVMKEFSSPWVRVAVAKVAPRKNVKRLGITIERGKRA